MDIATGKIRMHPRIETEGLACYPFQTPSDPFSAGSKRHQSVSSSSSWDVKCCGDQPIMMAHPVSPQDQDAISAATIHGYFPTVTPDMLMLDDFNPAMITYDGRRGSVTPASTSTAAHGPGDFHLPPYGYPTSTPSRQTLSRSNCSNFSENDRLDIVLEMDGAGSFDFRAPRTCPDLSSPTTTAYASSSNDRTPLMVLLSQQFSEPSTPRSSGSMSHSVIWGSSHSPSGDASPFMSPLTLSMPSSENQFSDGKISQTELALASPTPPRSSRTKARRSQCTRHRGRYCDKECGKLCKLPKIYSKEDNGHKCPECNQRFKRQEHLKRHARVHTKERPFACKVEDCKKQFSRSDNFKDHMRTHAKVGGRNTYVPGLRV